MPVSDEPGRVYDACRQLVSYLRPPTKAACPSCMPCSTKNDELSREHRRGQGAHLLLGCPLHSYRALLLLLPPGRQNRLCACSMRCCLALLLLLLLLLL